MVAEARLDPGLGQTWQLPLPGESTKVVTQPPGPSLCFFHGLGGILPFTPTGWGPCFPPALSTCAVAHLGKIHFVLKASSAPSLAKVTFTQLPPLSHRGP